MTALPGRVIKQAEIGPLDDSRQASFIASSNRQDRYGDIIEQEWELTDFWRNPTLLWGHNSFNLPVGWVREFSPSEDRSQSIARVEFAPAGHDEFVDKLVRAVNLRLVRAVSVGFIPLEVEDILDPRGRWDGYHFLRNQLIELSVCTIPANPDALNVARSIDTSPRFLRQIFTDPPPAPESRGFPRRGFGDGRAGADAATARSLGLALRNEHHDHPLAAHQRAANRARADAARL